MATGVTEDERASDEAAVDVRSGVADDGETRLFMADGGPIDVSVVRLEELTNDPFGRTLRTIEPRGAADTDKGSLLSLPLPASERTEGGRVTLGVPNMDDSRRRGALEAAAGVALAGVLAALLTYIKPCKNLGFTTGMNYALCSTPSA